MFQKGWREKRWSGWVVETLSAVFCHQLVGDVSLMSSMGHGVTSSDPVHSVYYREPMEPYNT